jgi:hypothetical protein
VQTNDSQQSHLRLVHSTKITIDTPTGPVRAEVVAVRFGLGRTDVFLHSRKASLALRISRDVPHVRLGAREFVFAVDQLEAKKERTIFSALLQAGLIQDTGRSERLEDRGPLRVCRLAPCCLEYDFVEPNRHNAKQRTREQLRQQLSLHLNR